MRSTWKDLSTTKNQFIDFNRENKVVFKEGGIVRQEQTHQVDNKIGLQVYCMRRFKKKNYEYSCNVVFTPMSLLAEMSHLIRSSWKEKGRSF